jgi:mRNA interferase YafO
VPFGHVQLTDSRVVLLRWSKIGDPFKRTVKDSESEHDLWLLYAQDLPENRYLMLSVFGPHAHKDSRFQSYIRTLKVDIVDPWLDGRLHCFEPPEDYEP